MGCKKRCFVWSWNVKLGMLSEKCLIDVVERPYRDLLFIDRSPASAPSCLISGVPVKWKDNTKSKEKADEILLWLEGALLVRSTVPLRYIRTWANTFCSPTDANDGAGAAVWHWVICHRKATFWPVCERRKAKQILKNDFLYILASSSLQENVSMLSKCCKPSAIHQILMG